MRIRSRAYLGAAALAVAGISFTGCSSDSESGVITLRVANWEEYIDEGDWDEEDEIELEDGTTILGENSMIKDFEEWYYETTGKKVKVEYSTFGTCEELYNQLTIGDVFDLACPSDYMIMKLTREGRTIPFSEDFRDAENEDNYYSAGVSPFVQEQIEGLEIDGMNIADYAAVYMWGTLGIVYNPEEVDEEDVKHWDIFMNDDYYKALTIKDSVRDAYFAALCIDKYNTITTDEFLEDEDYHHNLSVALNDTDQATVDRAQDILTDIKNRVYSFETDSGKADMVTGKVAANEQWSGDAVFTLDQAEVDGIELCYSSPEEGTNLWFDGWILLKDGIDGDDERQKAAEAFVNFVSMPENAIRNMFYIGYTSAISGGDSDLMFQYADWCYGAEEDEEDTVDYPIGYFFSDEEDADEEYVITAPADQAKRQLYAQYPPREVVEKAVIMECFSDEANARVNRMWTNIRCFDLGRLFGG